MTTAKGTFAIQMTPQPPYSEEGGVILARATFAKQFTGDFVGTSVVEFTSARTPIATSAAYVAVERLEGALAGRRGSFVVTQIGRMSGGTTQLAIAIVPDSGTGELAGIRGTMTIEVIEKQHHYTVTYDLT